MFPFSQPGHQTTTPQFVLVRREAIPLGVHGSQYYKFNKQDEQFPQAADLLMISILEKLGETVPQM
jgi:hypothetical protein